MNSLNHLPLNYTARIIEIVGNNKQRLYDVGFAPGLSVTAVLRSPLGGTTAYEVGNALIALRDEDAFFIKIERT